MKRIFLTISFIVLFILFFITIPQIIVSRPCMILPKPEVKIIGFPWKEIPCSYTGFVWGSSVLDRIIIFKKSVDEKGFYFLYC
jgi:hypothetical protein